MLTAKIFITDEKEDFNIPKIPDNLKEALKKIDQYIKLKVVLGIDVEDILTTEESLLEQAMKGFSASGEVAFSKSIMKAIAKEFQE